MSKHCVNAEGLGADTANEAEIVVIHVPKMEMIACVRQATKKHALRQEYIKKWSKGEAISMHKPEVEEWVMREDDVCQAEGEDVIQQHYISESQNGSQGGSVIYQAEGEDVIHAAPHFRATRWKSRRECHLSSRGGGCYTATLHQKTTQEKTSSEHHGCAAQTTNMGQSSGWKMV